MNIAEYQGEEIYNLGDIDSPEGIMIETNQFGYCVRATKDFKKGEAVYKIVTKQVPLSFDKHKFRVNGIYYYADKRNTMEFADYRLTYPIDGYTNHSCHSYNTCVTFPDQNDDSWNVAIRDISAGEEITYNYLHFDYEDTQQFQCMCGHPKCYGRILAFKYMSLEDQISLLHEVNEGYVKTPWLRDNPNIILVEDLKVPAGLELEKTKEGYALRARRAFQKDEVIFRFSPIQVGLGKILIYKTEEKYERWQGQGQDKFNYCANFAQSQNQPNCKLVQHGHQTLLMCFRKIQRNEQIKFETINVKAGQIL